MSLTPLPVPPTIDEPDLSVMIAASAGPVVVECHFAGWEFPWRALTPADWSELRRVLGERARLAVVETGRSRAFAELHGLEVIPAVLVLLRGEVVAGFTGRASVADVIAAVRRAQEREQTLTSALRELEALDDTRERSSPLRSVFRRRTGSPRTTSEGDSTLVRAS